MKLKNALLTVLFMSAGFIQQVSAQGSDSTAVPETFVYEWAGEEMVMQKYFLVFLKTGEKRVQEQSRAAQLQEEHLEYLGSLYSEGIIVLNGPTGDGGEIRGFSVYSAATLEEAEKLASADPMVQAGLLKVEVKPWWLAKGSVVY